MDKKKFLSALRDALSVLSEEELQDILNEYEQHIDMKVASGLTEEEATADFGDFQELTTELLEAYHVRAGTEPAEPKAEESAGEQVLGGIRSVGAGLSGILVSAVEWHWRNLKNLWNWLCRTTKTVFGWLWTTAKTFCGWLWRTAKDAGVWLWKTAWTAMAWLWGIAVMTGNWIQRAFRWCRRRICRPFVWLTTRGIDAGDDLLSDEEMRMEGIQVEGMQMGLVDDSGAAEPMKDRKGEAIQGEMEAGQAVYGETEMGQAVNGTAEVSRPAYGTAEAGRAVYETAETGRTAETAVSAAYGAEGQGQAGPVQEMKAAGQEQAGSAQEMKAAGQERADSARKMKAAGQEQAGSVREMRVAGQERADSARETRAAGQERAGSVRELKAAGQERAGSVREMRAAGQDQAAAGANGTAASVSRRTEKLTASTREPETTGRKRVDGGRTEPASVSQEKKGKRQDGFLRRFCRGIAAIVRWCWDVCLWWIRLVWNVFCIGICVLIGIMGALVLFLLGMCLVLVLDGYPLGGMAIILTGMTVCFFTLAGLVLTLIWRKNRGGSPGKKSGGTTVEGEKAAIEPAAEKFPAAEKGVHSAAGGREEENDYA